MKIFSKEQKKLTRKSFFWVILATFSVAVGFLFSTSTNLTKANFITQGTATSPTTQAYIPNNYQGSPNDQGTISVLVGTGIPVPIKILSASFNYNEDQMVFTEAAINNGNASVVGTALSGASSATATITVPSSATPRLKKLTMVITMPPAGATVAPGNVLFKLPLTIASGAAVGPIALNYATFHVVAATSYAESDPTMAAGNVITVVAQALSACATGQVWNCTTSACNTSGIKTTTCTAISPAPTTCSTSGVTNPSGPQDCVCNSNFDTSDWNCGAWSSCVNSLKSRSCTPISCKSGGSTNPVTQANVSCSLPPTSSITNCPANLLAATPHTKAHKNVVLKGPGTSWTVDGSDTNVTSGAVKLTNLSVGPHSVIGQNGTACTFTVECYTSIDTANARKAIGKVDAENLLLYDYDGDGDIGADDKRAIFNASKSCN